MINSKLPSIYYGGDYNPDQWPEEIWKEDMRLFKMAGINIITVPVFSWAKLQPEEDKYDFEWLDKVMNLAADNDIYVCLATSTAAQPAWMSKKYPEILPVDVNGSKRTHGGRVNFCPNSKVYRKSSALLAKKLAERYKEHKALLVWHIGNEYGNYCYCENCAGEFRVWLRKRYGTIEKLNANWNMSFWGHTVYNFDEIVVPSNLNNDNICFQGMALDYNRFMSESIMGCYINEYKAIKEVTPDVKITTNLMGTFKPLDYFKWADYMDVISWDNYPSATDEMSNIALRHDLMRSLKDGEPFMLMEQTPSQQNWQSYNSLKRPGVMRLWSYQALAHGADAIMFFQLRRSFGACEKYHGAVIAHVGNENTRVFRESAQLGKELKQLGDKLLDSRLNAKVAIVFDWENWWAVELSSGPSIDLKYVSQVEKYYKALYNMKIDVDLVKSDADLAKYSLVIAPVLYMIKPNVAKNIENYVKNGGTFVTTFFSGIVNESDIVTLGGYPGELRELLGIWAEEIDALLPDKNNSIELTKKFGKLKDSYKCGLLCDLINLEGAEALAVYGSDFYAGRPALTENSFGKGKAYYIATAPEQAFLDDFLGYLCDNISILRGPVGGPEGVEVTVRTKKDKKYVFVLNHNDFSVNIDLKGKEYLDLISLEKKSGETIIEAKGVFILE